MNRSALTILLLLVASPYPGQAHRMHQNMPMMGGKSIPTIQRRAGNPIPQDDASLKRGAKIYQINCAVCHGAEGVGDGPAAAGLKQKPRNLQMVAGRVSDKMISDHIKSGGPVMPPFKDALKENDVWDVTNFVQALAK